jgi:hypothetical protein
VYPRGARAINDAGVRTHYIVPLLVALGCGSKEVEPPLVTLTPRIEAQFAALGGECKSLRRIGGEPGAAPNVLQCQGPTSYVSVNSYEHGEIQSVELTLTGPPAELRKAYAKALAEVAPAEAIAAIQARMPDSGAVIENPELSRAGGLKLMIASSPSAKVWRYDVTLSWR